MENENANTNANQNNQEHKPTWRDAYITQDMSLKNIVHFFNILNERLCNIERLIKVPTESGEVITLEDFYAQQMQVEQDNNNHQGE